MAKRLPKASATDTPPESSGDPASETTQKQADAGQSQDYVARCHIFHDGDEYFEGDKLSLTDEQAKSLLDIQAIDAKAAE